MLMMRSGLFRTGGLMCVDSISTVGLRWGRGNAECVRFQFTTMFENDCCRIQAATVQRLSAADCTASLTVVFQRFGPVGRVGLETKVISKQTGSSPPSR